MTAGGREAYKPTQKHQGGLILTNNNQMSELAMATNSFIDTKVDYFDLCGTAETQTHHRLCIVFRPGHTQRKNDSLHLARAARENMKRT